MSAFFRNNDRDRCDDSEQCQVRCNDGESVHGFGDDDADGWTSSVIRESEHDPATKLIVVYGDACVGEVHIESV